MTTPVGVMQNFMRALMNDKSSSTQVKLDNAVRTATNGTFNNINAAINAFINEVTRLKDSSMADRKRFLAERCGIIMDNADTGAILGSDASSYNGTKTAESIVNEGGNTYIGKYSSYSTIHGINVDCRESSDTKDNNQLIFLSRLMNVWLDKAMTLVEQSYGVSFSQAGIKEMVIRFDKDKTTTRMSAGVNNGKLVLNINPSHYANLNDIDFSNENGKYKYDDLYIDRVVAHELTHSFMQATVKNMGALPLFVMEGMAELTHGADDDRYNKIYSIFDESSSFLHKILNVQTTNSEDSFGNMEYAAGYTFFRFLMQQSATEGKRAVGDLSFNDYFFDDNHNKCRTNYTDFVVNGSTSIIDLSETTADYKVTGTSKDNKIYLGSGNITVKFGKGSGHDTIYGFRTNESKIEFTDKSFYNFNYNNSGDDVSLTFNANDSLLIKNKANGFFRLDDKWYSVVVGNRNGASGHYNNPRYYTDVNYLGFKDTYNETIRVLDGETVKLTDSNLQNIDVLDARESGKRVNLTGGTSTGTLYGSAYDDDLYGTAGNTTFDGYKGADRIHCGIGIDTIKVSSGTGHDVVSDFDTNKDKVVSVNGGPKMTDISGNDVYLYYGNNDILQLKGVANKSFLLDGWRTVVLPQNKANTVTYAANTAYYGSKEYYNTLKVTTGAHTIHLYDSNFHDIDTLDASSSSSRVAMAGSNGSSTLYGSKYDDDLAGSDGNTTFNGEGGADRIWCKGGVDTIMYGVGSGRDVVTWFDTSKDKIQAINNAALRNVGTYGNDVYLRFSTGDDVLQIKDIVNKSFQLNGKRTMVMASDRDNTVDFAAGTEYYGSKSRQDTLRVLTGNQTIHLYDANFRDVDVLDARSANSRVAMAGSNGTSVLHGSRTDDDLAGTETGNTTFYGEGGADRIWCKGGADTIMFGVGSGRDVVNWFDTNKDRIQSFNASLRNVGTYGNDVYLRYSTGDDVLQVKDIVNKSFLLDGKRTMVMAQDRENTVTYSADTTYYGSKSKQDTLKVNNGERVHLYDGHIHDIEVLDGRQATRAVLLGGGNGTGTLYGSNYDDDLAGTAGTTHIHGGKGNDRIWAKGGKDIIYFGSGDGQDTVYNGGSSDKLVFYDVSDISKLQVSRSGRNVMIGLKGRNDKVTLNEWGSNSLRSVQLSNGAEYRLNDNLSFSKTGISYMSQVQALAHPAKTSVTAAQTAKLSELAMEIKPMAAISGMDKKQMGM
ncbi:calcium-binding protein [Selenomonas ruminantium]|uniref:calcium-binding protein n=1 Tax=Selenomonas ruminantium TaxID=971 RepID=UPI0026F1E27B|nr:calcium-binding protein [Selenomonas ruminantium]